MKVNKLLNSNVAVVLTVAAIGAGVVYYAGKKAEKTVQQLGGAINPLNDKNIFASGVDAVGAKLSGNQSWNLGGWIYDITH